ncbi:hypothetical protein ERC79_00745 [Rhodococcus sp. ABRD24]|uniref:hypothetical protein n=1 Tax=Rhodococcus sp. ABRD24 TaxID=2507582 RepID=UPI0010404732|nr:hypothetical protein [Rhodococcus sp. ABRD24]QBJ94657.1 hypothetical protein ERC79_00745 [Rhodococcus sp. ABRD24]
MTVYRTSAELAQRIRATVGDEIRPVHEYLASVVGHDGALRIGRGPALVASSVELDDVTVSVSVSWDDPSFLGTFDRTADTRLVRVVIGARLVATPAPEHSLPPAVELSRREEIAWLRVVLGGLADYAYRIVTDMSVLRGRPAWFIVLVDRHGTPRLAPSDFEWILASYGGRHAYREKVVPEDPDLLRGLRRNGDLVPVEQVPHPQAAPPEVWAQQFVSHLTATIADQLGRTNMSDWFTFDEISLHGTNRVVVRYTWHLVAGDKAYGFDIDLAGVRAQRLRLFDDPRACSAAWRIGTTPFDQPVFRDPPVIDGVTWIRFGVSE